MKRRVEPHEWVVVQDRFSAEDNRFFESIFSLGNGYFGGRGNFEEKYSGDTLQGNYLAGIYYPDPTRVGWWKNGYPDYFAKVLNAADWKRLELWVDGEPIDLATCEISEFRRVLHMRDGYLERTFTASLPSGKTVHASVVRFLSMTRTHIGALRYRVTPVGFDATIRIVSSVDGDVTNEDSNYDEGFWEEDIQTVESTRCFVQSRTKKTGFVVGTSADFTVTVAGSDVGLDPAPTVRKRFAAATTEIDVPADGVLEAVKYGANFTSRDVEPPAISEACNNELDTALSIGFDQLFDDHKAAWNHKWETSDVVIGGDVEMQQGVRFNIFSLNSTFTGEDPELNIGPKGFTGEKYGGVTYWDTEAFCLPFYLATSDPSVSKNLLRYRHRHLGRAIENAAKLGFDNGAALYPMVTINGEECHNEWEITFEEIHRNGAIAFAIYDYIRNTGDVSYLLEGGLDVLIGISRFWSQRVSFSEPKQKWVILGVTGPNEYENNVDNNWYTNTMAQWTLRYTIEALKQAKQLNQSKHSEIVNRTNLNEAAETGRWEEVVNGLYFPYDDNNQIFLQQDNYLEKEQVLVQDLDPTQRPINKHWSWDRILRSCFIKQADVLQGMWLFEERHDLATLERNFDFYEKRTVHESSLSPSIHSVLAVRLNRLEKAHEMLLRSARLDIDDYNADTDEGCHTTSMAGTWIGAVFGFGGMRVVDGELTLNPTLAPGWTSLRFNVFYRGVVLTVDANRKNLAITNNSNASVEISLRGKHQTIPGGETVRYNK